MKKSIKKVLSLIIVFVFLSSLFSACNTSKSDTSEKSTQLESTNQDKDSGENKNDGGVKKEKPVTLNLWIWSVKSSVDAYKKNIQSFESSNQNIKIEMTEQPTDNYETVLKTAIAGGDAPDIFITHGWNNLRTYVDSGNVESLEGKIDVSMYDKASLAPVTIDGQLFAAPGESVNVLTAMYNKKIFKENGLGIPKTYSDFENICNTLKEKRIIPIAMGGADAFSYLFTMYAIAPAVMTPSWFDDARVGSSTFQDERFYKANNLLKEWWDKGFYPNGFEGVNIESARLLFTSEKAAIIFAGTWDIGMFRDNSPELQIGAFAFPGKDGIVGTRSANAGFSVYSKSKNKEQAVNVVKYFAMKDAVAKRIDITGAIPVIKGIEVSDETVKEANSADKWEEFLFTPFNIYGIENTNPQDIWMKEIIEFMTGGIPVEELANKVDKVWDKKKFVNQFK